MWDYEQKTKTIRKKTTLKFYKAMAVPVLLYESETLFTENRNIQAEEINFKTYKRMF